MCLRPHGEGTPCRRAQNSCCYRDRKTYTREEKSGHHHLMTSVSSLKKRLIILMLYRDQIQYNFSSQHFTPNINLLAFNITSVNCKKRCKHHLCFQVLKFLQCHKRYIPDLFWQYTSSRNLVGDGIDKFFSFPCLSWFGLHTLGGL